ncbi:M6 family metalloprotease domain-containing protein [Streptomyces carpaticus]|uniref:M6 family metalloprotease domain-containing protein n=1 Tax=Streptomyces cheonanensis TaxID=312720 RepID=A0ABN2VA86_9ACTN|nr:MULTISPECIES: M6 family metalloprotease domain-containing protein [Streptomyces]QKV68890.1 M6 family metalloprotease domain-containing protein [Streptomyces harbinensis]UWM49551.1 M6 family metalloprotease domain-containing protein [Streptomyces carpaticus]
MPHIPGRPRRALVAVGGSLALVIGSTPGTAPVLPHHLLRAAAATDGACAPAEHEGLSVGMPTSPGYTPTTGTITALTVFIDFPGAEARGSTHERYAEFFPATSDYFRTSSYGLLDYRAEPVHRWLRMSQPFEAYGIDRGAGWHPEDPQGYNRLIEEIVAALGEEVDHSAYDLVNVLATPNAGPPATEKVLSVSFPGRPLAETPTGTLSNVSFIWSRQPGESPHRVLVHENGHAFGLPDLYWTGQDDAPLLAGHWDVMEQDWGPTNDFLAWHKWKLGWLTDAEVVCVPAGSGPTEYTLLPVADPGTGTGVKLLALRTGPSEAIAVEVRTPAELDSVVCRPGVLISRVDAAVPTGRGPVRVEDATPGSAGCQTLPDPQVTAELTDAPFVPGETFTDEAAGVRVEVLAADPDGSHRVRVTRW